MLDGAPTLEYHVVDVFTAQAFAGNPLAVVLGGEALDARRRQLLAGEFHLSETAFPLEPTDDERARGVTYGLRIHTPAVELPFAGHPSVGAAWTMAALGRVRPGRVVQACGAGDLPLEVAPAGGPVRLVGGAPSVRTAVAAGVDVRAALRAVGLDDGDLAGAPEEVRVAGTGIDFVHLVVRPGAVARAVPDVAALVRLAPPGARLSGLVVASFGGAGGAGGAGEGSDERAAAVVHARVFAADVGVAEDAATGSAALGLGVQAVARGLLPGDGPSGYVVSQGREMGRPSTLTCDVLARGGSVVEAGVRGEVVPVASGRIRVPA